MQYISIIAAIDSDGIDLEVLAGVFALVAALVGVGAAAAWEWWKAKRLIADLASALRSELAGNLKMVLQKRDILNQASEKMDNGEALPVSGLRFMSVIYDQHFPTLAVHYSEATRYSLHVIYETQRTFDEAAEATTAQLLGAKSHDDLDDYLIRLWNMIGPLYGMLAQIQKLGTAQLRNAPESVLDLQDDRGSMRRQQNLPGPPKAKRL